MAARSVVGQIKDSALFATLCLQKMPTTYAPAKETGLATCETPR